MPSFPTGPYGEKLIVITTILPIMFTLDYVRINDSYMSIVNNKLLSANILHNT